MRELTMSLGAWGLLQRMPDDVYYSSLRELAGLVEEAPSDLAGWLRELERHGLVEESILFSWQTTPAGRELLGRGTAVVTITIP